MLPPQKCSPRQMPRKLAREPLPLSVTVDHFWPIFCNISVELCCIANCLHPTNLVSCYHEFEIWFMHINRLWNIGKIIFDQLQKSFMPWSGTVWYGMVQMFMCHHYVNNDSYHSAKLYLVRKNSCRCLISSISYTMVSHILTTIATTARKIEKDMKL